MSRLSICTRLAYFAIATAALVTVAHGYRLNSKLIDSPSFPAQPPQSQQSHPARHSNAAAAYQRLVDQPSTASVGYVKASIPIRIFQCMQHASILRCVKLFILQRMERTASYANSGNVTADFLDQMLREGNDDDDDAADHHAHVNGDALIMAYADLADVQLNERLLQSFRRFFRNREIKLYFVPGMVVKVVPSPVNYLNFSVRKAKSVDDWERALRNKDLEIPADDDSVKEGGGGGGGGGGGLGGGKHKHKTSEYLLQLGVPALMMPVILLGTVLPFLLPALKMATILTTVINHGALITAALYAAKQAAFADDKVVYYNSGYHRDFGQF